MEPVISTGKICIYHLQMANIKIQFLGPKWKNIILRGLEPLKIMNIVLLQGRTARPKSYKATRPW